MAKGRLGIQEKYIIQGMLNDSKTVKQIAATLERSVGAVTKYVEGELNDIQKTVASVDIDRVATLEAEIATKSAELTALQDAGMTVDQMRQVACDRLRAINGMGESTPGRLVAKAIEINGTPPNVDILYGWAVLQLKTKDFIIHETAHKKDKTVAIMTRVASERADAAREQMPSNTLSRTARTNLFNIETGEIME